jgi:hypothetical protein
VTAVVVGCFDDIGSQNIARRIWLVRRTEDEKCQEEGRTEMYSALLVPPGGDVREVTMYSPDAIAAILRDPHVDCLTSDDGLIDFWFRPSIPTRYRPNPHATEFLLVNSSFTAKTVPLLYGSVIICSRSAEGRLMGLTALDHQQLHSSSRLARRRLQWRSRVHSDAAIPQSPARLRRRILVSRDSDGINPGGQSPRSGHRSGHVGGGR